MRGMSSKFLTLILAFGMAAAPTSAAPVTAPLGVVMVADRAQVGNSQASNGSTIFPGDRLVTAENGNLQVQLGGIRARLLPGSLAIVNNTDQGLSADLLSGTVDLTSAAGEHISIVANHAVVRPVTAAAVVAQITRISPSELLLSATQGSLEVTYDDEIQIVRAGSSYRMLVDPDPPAGPGPAGVRRKSRKRAIFLLGTATAAATGIGILATTGSPAPVSPSAP